MKRMCITRVRDERARGGRRRRRATVAAYVARLAAVKIDTPWYRLCARATRVPSSRALVRDTTSTRACDGRTRDSGIDRVPGMGRNPSCTPSTRRDRARKVRARHRTRRRVRVRGVARVGENARPLAAVAARRASKTSIPRSMRGGGRRGARPIDRGGLFSPFCYPGRLHVSSCARVLALTREETTDNVTAHVLVAGSAGAREQILAHLDCVCLTSGPSLPQSHRFRLLQARVQPRCASESPPSTFLSFSHARARAHRHGRRAADCPQRLVSTLACSSSPRLEHLSSSAGAAHAFNPAASGLDSAPARIERGGGHRPSTHRRLVPCASLFRRRARGASAVCSRSATRPLPSSIRLFAKCAPRERTQSSPRARLFPPLRYATARASARRRPRAHPIEHRVFTTRTLGRERARRRRARVVRENHPASHNTHSRSHAPRGARARSRERRTRRPHPPMSPTVAPPPDATSRRVRHVHGRARRGLFPEGWLRVSSHVRRHRRRLPRGAPLREAFATPTFPRAIGIDPRTRSRRAERRGRGIAPSWT